MGSHQPIRKTVLPEPVAIPDKLYFRIGDVARLCGVPAYVLRFWETEFPQLKPNKGGTGQRLYRKKDVEMALRIKSLLYDQGYTIPGARQVFKAETQRTDVTSGEVAEGATAMMPSAPQIAAPASFDAGAEMRRRAQLLELRDEIADLANMLSGPAVATKELPSVSKAMRPRLVLEPKPFAKPAAQTTLVLLNQGDLFGAE